MADYYQILGVSPDADAEEIRRRYRFLAKAYHPDRYTDLETKAEAEKEMQRINEAYAVLSNLDKRAVYDRQMDQTTEQGEGSHSDSVSSDYSRSLGLFFDQLLNKWAKLIQVPIKSVEIDSSIELIINNFALLLRGIYPSPEYPPAKKAIEEINQSLLFIVMINTVLGAELETSGGLPKQYSWSRYRFFHASRYTRR